MGLLIVVSVIVMLVCYMMFILHTNMFRRDGGISKLKGHISVLIANNKIEKVGSQT